MARIKTKKRQEYAFEESRHSGRGILAVILGGISMLAFVILVSICALLGGQGGAWTGSIGFSAFVAAFCGMVFGLKSFHDQCRSYIFCKVGTLLSGFMVAVWFLIFCVGLAQ